MHANHRKRIGLTSATLTLALVACGGSSSTTGATNAGAPASDAGTTPDDAGAADGTAFPPYSSSTSGGDVYISNVDTGGAIGAAFYGDGPLGMRKSVVNGCEVLEYSISELPFPTSGALSVSGGALASEVHVTPDAQGEYSSHFMTSLFAVSNTLTVESSGGDVPAFAVTTLPAPEPAVVTSPTVDAGGKFVVAHDQDLAVTWTGADAVLVTIGSGNLQILCPFQSSAHAGSIPGSLIARIGAEDPTAFFALASDATVLVPGSDIHVHVQNDGVEGNIAFH